MSDGAAHEIEAPPILTEPRNYVGWVLLAFIFLLMFVTSLAGSLAAKPKAPVAEESGMSLVLSLEVSQRRLLASLPQGSEDDRKRTEAQAVDMLREPISDLAPKSQTDPEASRLYAAMRTERGDPVAPENLAPLRKSEKPADRALAEIYGSAKLTKERAQELVKQLPDSPFEYRLAKVHALEKAGDTSVRMREFTGHKAIGIIAVVFIGFGILLGSAVAWALFRTALRGRKLEDTGMPLGAISLADADRLAVRAAQFFAVFLVLSIAVPLLIKGTAGYLVSGIAMIVAVPALSWFPVNGKRISASAVGMSGRNFGRNVLWGIGGFFAELPITGILMIVGAGLFRFLPAPSHPISEQLTNAKSLTSVLPLVLFGSITAPLWEEFVFRGLIFPGLARLIGRIVPAAIATGFAFAMIHPQGAAAWLALAAVGATGCALTYYTRSLIPTIVMHMLHNTTIFVLALMMLAQP